VGFTIFIIGLIIVATMIPGLMLGWQRSISIDYDAVAYRTGVILAEDAGHGTDPTHPRWEIFSSSHKDEVQRLGLTVHSPHAVDAQNVLSPIKVAKFFNSARYNNATLLHLVYPDDYRSKVIFGDIPYQFNISLKTFDSSWNERVGSPLPSNYGYGYIRRVVKVKEISNMTIEGSNQHWFGINASLPLDPSFNSTVGNLTIGLNCTVLLGDTSVPTMYGINPNTEPLWINITGFERYLNNSASGNPWAVATGGSYLNATLQKIELYKYDDIAKKYSKWVLSDSADHYGQYLLLVDGQDANLTPNMTMSSSICFRMNPDWIPFTSNDWFQVRYTWNDMYRYNVSAIPHPLSYLPNQTPPHTAIFATDTAEPQYDYNPANVTQPYLRDGVLEVMVW
jgi:hypothetical protein